MANNLAVVSAADAGYFDLLQGTVRSLRDRPQGRGISLYVFDLGLSEPQRRWLLVQGAALRRPEGLPGCEDLPIHLQAFLSRCRIPELFPPHDIYLWIDADAWIQRWEAVEAFIDGAHRTGFAITPETDPAYDAKTVLTAHRRPFAMFGPAALEGLRVTGPLNAGVFAGRADAPHWREWRGLVEAAVGRTRDLNLLFLLDQTALSVACTQRGLSTALLPTTSNWIAHFALPMVSEDGGTLMRPLPPHEALGIVHQTWFTKRDFFTLHCVAGGFLSRTLSYQAHSQLRGDEYVSPGLTVIMPDRCFPNIVGEKQAFSEARDSRRGSSPAGLADHAMPGPGPLNRDEVHILYNLALGFRGKQALAIGCLMGWSACHLALAGLGLDVIDPLLADPEVAGSVQASLKAARVPGPVRLIPARFPAGVRELASARGGWSLFLLGGDHESEAPIAVAQACERCAAPDCAIVFHGLVSPDVTDAVQYLRARGWRIRVYYTAQFMAVAWRGDVRPVAHQPDPRSDWRIPDHVMPLLA